MTGICGNGHEMDTGAKFCPRCGSEILARTDQGDAGLSVDQEQPSTGRSLPPRAGVIVGIVLGALALAGGIWVVVVDSGSDQGNPVTVGDEDLSVPSLSPESECVALWRGLLVEGAGIPGFGYTPVAEAVFSEYGQASDTSLWYAEALGRVSLAQGSGGRPEAAEKATQEALSFCAAEHGVRANEIEVPPDQSQEVSFEDCVAWWHQAIVETAEASNNRRSTSWFVRISEEYGSQSPEVSFFTTAHMEVFWIWQSDGREAALAEALLRAEAVCRGEVYPD